jgi:hypothetical protein
MMEFETLTRPASRQSPKADPPSLESGDFPQLGVAELRSSRLPDASRAGVVIN